jgi:predicted aconitase
MKLTDEEKQMLDGEMGPAFRKSMEILVAMCEIYDAERMVRVASVHTPGCSVVVAGEAGVKFVEEMAKSVDAFAVLTTLNPGALDRNKWSELGLTEADRTLQNRLTLAYEKMGGVSIHTCTPYFIGNIPRKGEHVAWGESSAVIYANSVLGAKTNREGGPTALASAITGLTPAYGFHLDENRKGQLLVNLNVPIKGFYDYGNLGYHVGKIAADRVPVFTGISPEVTWDELKILGAALASSGAVALYHIVGVSPETPTLEAAFDGLKPSETYEIGQKELDAAAENLNRAPGKDVDWVFLGCPHTSIKEFAEIASLLDGKRLHNGVDLWVSSSVAVKAMADGMGYSRIIEDAGGLIVCETCPVLALSDRIAERKGYRSITTNSAKMAHYMPGQFNILTHYGSLKKCLEAAVSGHWE